MSWHDDPPGKRRNYHHGNLREALIQAALRLIGEKGPAGFTFAEAARAAGVSPAAPYRHFRDRDELMADVACRGFEEFTKALRAAWDEGRPAAPKAFGRVGRAYLKFAREEPAVYSAMFESGLQIAAHPRLHAAADAAFAVVMEGCETVLAAFPPARRPPTLMVALHVWSQTHGIASLFARGDASRRPLPMTPEDLLEAAMLVYFDGLAAAAR